MFAALPITTVAGHVSALPVAPGLSTPVGPSSMPLMATCSQCPSAACSEPCMTASLDLAASSRPPALASAVESYKLAERVPVRAGNERTFLRGSEPNHAARISRDEQSEDSA